jgi:hypothetical protein
MAAVLTLVAFLTVSACGVAASGLEASGVEGEGEATIDATNPEVLIRGESAPTRASLQADHLHVKNTTLERETVEPSTPAGDVPLASVRGETVETSGFSSNPELRISAFHNDDSTLLVAPYGSKAELSVTHQGQYVAEPVDHRLLESAHFINESSSTWTNYAYNYTVNEVVGLNLDGVSELTLDGDFRLYLWETSFSVMDDELTTYQTGHARTSYTQSGEAVYHEEFEYAVATVLNGTLDLRLTANGGPEQREIFANQFKAETGTSGQAHFVNASGTLDGENGARVGDGETLTTSAGAYTWKYDSDSELDAHTREPPTTVSGGQAVPSQTDSLPEVSGWAFTAVAGGVLLAVLALVPTMIGYRRRHRPGCAGGRAWPESSDDLGWSDYRALGYHVLAVRAERKQWYRLAADFAKRAHKLRPEHPGFLVDGGSFLREAGCLRKALTHHRRAHERLRLDPEKGKAYNAYEAARAAARSGDHDRAKHWLRIGLQEDPFLASKAQDEPDFAELWTEDAFRVFLAKHGSGSPGPRPSA